MKKITRIAQGIVALRFIFIFGSGLIGAVLAIGQFWLEFFHANQHHIHR